MCEKMKSNKKLVSNTHLGLAGGPPSAAIIIGGSAAIDKENILFAYAALIFLVFFIYKTKSLKDLLKINGIFRNSLLTVSFLSTIIPYLIYNLGSNTYALSISKTIPYVGGVVIFLLFVKYYNKNHLKKLGWEVLD